MVVRVPAFGACTAWDNSACTGTQHCPPRCPRFWDDAGDPVLVRPLADGELDSLVDMYDAVPPEHRTMGVPPRTRADIESWLDAFTSDGWNLLALADDRVVGHVGVAPDDDRATFVVFVHPDRHGRGIGTELVKHAVAYAADRDYDELVLEVSSRNERAIHVYENVGFEPSDDDAFCVEMRLPLSSPLADYLRRPPADR